MDANTTTPAENEDLTPEVQDEEEDFSSGNRRLAIIVGAIVAIVVLGYVLLPAQATRRLAAVMPVMELGEATVTGARATEEAKPAEEATAEEEATKSATSATKTVAAARPTAAATTTATIDAPATTVAEEPVAIEPVPAAAAPAPEAAPATVTMSGRILDENGRPMAGATVMVRGSKKVTGTDANGNYTLEVPAGDNTLVYGYGGYEDQEVRTRSTQPQNVTLLPREGATRRRR
ncbi:carboxypeptidase-like regulatory domain-containing protein [Hymenobacter perfusus]|uniref:Carboxypeptidase-like regulatory domain-containing protein n=1 Tax=Hymenobacter perfusus TaxID=1236770 RepID=A0A428KDL9_9BACT|nr:carboxypeptidase-like regulatory domain-containing protein [Hymenobacter perfusus]RSK44530.1 hypothetical protein EI293_08415 [Hymenobacter perfusus]